MVDFDAVAGYVQQARQGLLELLEQEHAAFWAEVQAKIADELWPTLPNPVDPHHLTTVRRQLIEEGVIEPVSAPTRGGGIETVLAFTDRADRPGGVRAFENAASRKRLLAARYHSWGRSLPGHPNVLGPAGERVVHSTLLAAAPGRYTLLPAAASGEVAHMFGKPVPGGSLDNAAYLTLTDALGRPTGVVTVLIEVKNVRHWIYPDSAELYDLLDKAARLQFANTGHPFVPVLVCRRAHPTTFEMALQLGFFVIATRAQFLLNVKGVNPSHVQQVDNHSASTTWCSLLPPLCNRARRCSVGLRPYCPCGQHAQPIASRAARRSSRPSRETCGRTISPRVSGRRPSSSCVSVLPLCRIRWRLVRRHVQTSRYATASLRSALRDLCPPLPGLTAARFGAAGDLLDSHAKSNQVCLSQHSYRGRTNYATN